MLRSTAVLVISTLVVQLVPANGQRAEKPVTAITIQIVEGQGAINNVKRGAAFEPVVEVRDQQGTPLVGATVTFTLPAVGPSATFPDGS